MPNITLKANAGFFIIDSHFHLNHLKELEPVILRALSSQVNAGIIAGVWNEDTLENLQLEYSTQNNLLTFVENNISEIEIKNNQFICFLSHGFHPMIVHEKWLNCDGSKNTEIIEEQIYLFEQILKENRFKIWAIGETGFDLSSSITKHDKCKNFSKTELFALQNIAFEVCVKNAVKYNLPLILHPRANSHMCYERIAWAKALGVQNIMIHCYSGSAEEMKKYNILSIYYSFGGVTTWGNANKTKKSYLACPKNYLMLETDSPDLSPELENGFRPEKNEPSFLNPIAKKLALYSNENWKELVLTSNHNILRFLGISN